MRILLTGSSGYIGARLVSRLKQAGHHVIGLDRAPCAGDIPDDFIECDLLEKARYAPALEHVDAIWHLAAAKGDWGISEAEYFRDNLDATRALLEAAREAGVRKWIFYSTVSTLGPSDKPLDESAPRRPANPYGASKAACEELFDLYLAEEPDAHVLTIRPSVVFGPGNPWNTNIFRLIEAIHKNRFLMIGRGQEVKTTSYIENLLDAHMFLFARQSDGNRRGHDIYHYVDEPGETTAALVAQIHGLLGRKPPSLHLPLAIASPLAALADAAAWVTGIDLPITSARIRKFCTATNFSAAKIRREGFRQNVANEEALRRTVDWFLSEYIGAAH